MKIKMTVKETVWRELEVNTDDFDFKSNTGDNFVFELAELINEIKADPEELLEQNEGEVVESRESISVIISSVK